MKYAVVSFDRYDAQNSTVTTVEADSPEEAYEAILFDVAAENYVWEEDEDPTKDPQVQQDVVDIKRFQPLKKGAQLWGWDNEEESGLIIPLDNIISS